VTTELRLDLVAVAHQDDLGVLLEDFERLHGARDLGSGCLVGPHGIEHDTHVPDPLLSAIDRARERSCSPRGRDGDQRPGRTSGSGARAIGFKLEQRPHGQSMSTSMTGVSL